MTGWLIAGMILFLLAGLLFTPAVLHLTVQDNALPVIRLSFLGIPLYRSGQAKPESPSRRSRSKKKRKQKSKKDTSGKNQTDTEKRSLSEWCDLIHDALCSIGKGLRCLMKHTHFRHVSIYIGVGDWDAADCAAAYAKLNASLYPCLAVLGTLCPVSYDAIDVRCCFGQEQTRYYLSGTIRLSLAGVFAAGFTFLFSFLWQTLQRKQEESE